MADLCAIENLLAGKLSAGVVVQRGLAPRPGASPAAAIAGQAAALRRAHAEEPPDGFAWTRRLYRQFAIDPTKHRPSSEALWRRLRARGVFPAVHPLVDLTNLLSLRFQVPYGLYDLERLQGAVTLDLGRDDDRYQGIRKEVLGFRGKIVLRDELGAFGNPSADSQRACVGPGSRDILHVLFFHPGDPRRQNVLDATGAACDEFFAVAERRSFFA